MTAMIIERTPSRRGRLLSRPNLRFAGHFVEMLVAMFVGMFALDPVWSLAAPGLADRPDAAAVIMATNMTAGMALWMSIRRHSWPRIAEMSAAMYLPFLVMLVPYWLGAVSGHAVLMVGHVAMVPLMLAAMLWRRADYSHHHGSARHR
jgi:hypothetical protein